MQVYVKAHGFSTLSVSVTPGASVAELKRLVAAAARDAGGEAAAAFGKTSSSFRLLFAGRELDDDRCSLGDRQLAHESVLHLILRTKKPSLRDYEVLEKIGGKDITATQHGVGYSMNGVCSYVYRARPRQPGDGGQVALKVMINMCGTSRSTAIGAAFDSELALLSNQARLPLHDNIVAVHAAFQDTVVQARLPGWNFDPSVVNSRTMVLVMPFYSEDLKHALNAARRNQAVAGGHGMPERRAVSIAADLLRAVQHLKRHQVLHRDVKLDNVLLETPRSTQRERAILSDFGMSLDAREFCEDGFCVPLRLPGWQRGGAQIALAPEITMPRPGRSTVLDYEKNDDWAVGIIFHQLLSAAGHAPFSDMDSPATFSDDSCIPVSGSVSTGVAKVIRGLLRINRVHRLDCTQALHELDAAARKRQEQEARAHAKTEHAAAHEQKLQEKAQQQAQQQAKRQQARRVRLQHKRASKAAAKQRAPTRIEIRQQATWLLTRSMFESNKYGPKYHYISLGPLTMVLAHRTVDMLFCLVMFVSCCLFLYIRNTDLPVSNVDFDAPATVLHQLPGAVVVYFVVGDGDDNDVEMAGVYDPTPVLCFGRPVLKQRESDGGRYFIKATKGYNRFDKAEMMRQDESPQRWSNYSTHWLIDDTATCDRNGVFVSSSDCPVDPSGEGCAFKWFRKDTFIKNPLIKVENYVKFKGIEEYWKGIEEDADECYNGYHTLALLHDIPKPTVLSSGRIAPAGIDLAAGAIRLWGNLLTWDDHLYLHALFLQAKYGDSITIPLSDTNGPRPKIMLEQEFWNVLSLLRAAKNHHRVRQQEVVDCELYFILLVETVLSEKGKSDTGWRNRVYCNKTDERKQELELELPWLKNPPCCTRAAHRRQAKAAEARRAAVARIPRESQISLLKRPLHQSLSAEM